MVFSGLKASSAIFSLTGKDNVIKNIYLFPEDYLIPCYTYTAKFNGKVVPGGVTGFMRYAMLNAG